MMATETVRVSFMRARTYLPLAVRNELFRDAVLKFEPRPAVFLLREGFAPLPLADASDNDVMFSEAVEITGTLLPTSKLVLP
jgi:hypothetical protein